MALLQHDLGLDKWAGIIGLKRKFLGCESDKSLARRVVMEMGKINPMLRLAEGMRKIFAPRVCIREEFVEAEGQYKALDPLNSYEYSLKEWTFHYSDGTEETVTRRERSK